MSHPRRTVRAMTNRMLPSDRLDIDVEVLVDGTWWPGVLEHRRQDDDHWLGFVRWTQAPGENRIGWYPYEQLRQVTAAAASPADRDDGPHGPEPRLRSRP